MNDIGYVNIDYKGSYAENTVKGIQCREDLLYRRGYTEGAIEFHKKEQNPKTIKFFESELKLIDKMLKQKRFNVRDKYEI